MPTLLTAQAPAVWGMPLQDLLMVVATVLLFAATVVYVVFTRLLWRESQRQREVVEQQRNDLVQARLLPRVLTPDGVNYVVEVVNAGPGHATDVTVDLHYRDADGRPEKHVTLPLPALLAGESRQFAPPDVDQARVDCTLAWTHPTERTEDTYSLDLTATAAAEAEALVVLQEERRPKWLLDQNMRIRLRMLARELARAVQEDRSWWGTPSWSANPGHDAAQWADTAAWRLRWQTRRLWTLVRTLLPRWVPGSRRERT